MAFEEQLIKAVKQSPIIYDKLADGYNSMLARENAWKKIGDKVGQPDIAFLKKRWRSLRDTFIKYYRIEKNREAINGSAKSKRWRYYNNMSFLISHIEHKITMNSFNAVDETVNQEGEENEDGDENEEYKFEGIEDNEVSVKNENIYVQMDEDSMDEPSSKIQCLEVETSNPLKETYNPLKQTALNTGDPDIHFLLSCAPSLKRLPPRKNLLARIQIQKLLYEFEYGNENEYE